MKTVANHIGSLILPITVILLVPYAIEDNFTLHTGLHLYVGVLFILIGLSIMTTTILSFIQIGKGTLAPWAPTQKLVITGLYRYVRNPMILGVFIVLLGEAASLWSLPILIWSAAFFVINTIYFILSEEPGLDKRFGANYLFYKKHVHRWMPRLTPFHFDQTNKR